jgi:hypothetical protein
MSSWHRPPIKIQKKLGYVQETPFGTFIKKDKPATVVSAYYTMKSRTDDDTYKQRMRLFLENIPCHLIFFTDESLVDFVKDCRKKFQDRTIVMPINRIDWVANIKFTDAFWKTQHEKNPEKDLHSTDLYKMWYEKKEFVLTAIELNPFEHDDFIWMDAGIIREDNIIPLIKDNFPVASRIPTDRILLLNVNPFLAEDEEVKNNIMGDFTKKDRIAAGIIAGCSDVWLKWSDIYDTTVERYIKADMFIGKEQSIMSTIVLENKNLVSLIKPPKNFSRKWFYSLIYIGVSENRFKVLNTFAANNLDSYESIGRLYA